MEQRYFMRNRFGKQIYFSGRAAFEQVGVNHKVTQTVAPVAQAFGAHAVALKPLR